MTITKSPTDPKTNFSINNIVLVLEATALNGCNCNPEENEVHHYNGWIELDMHVMKGQKSYIKVPTFITDSESGRTYPRRASLFCMCQVHADEVCDCKER